MNDIRPAAVAGSFYPAERRLLESAVDAYLAQARPTVPPPRALIAPHAGYIYSGPVAASAYATLVPLGSEDLRIVLLGPAHRYPVRGLAATTASAFHTPLGNVPVDQTALDHVRAFDYVTDIDAAHAGEHSLEVQLPFLQRVLKRFSIIPLVVGDVAPEQVCRVLDALWDEPGTLAVISSDLSHYHDPVTAREMDSATSMVIEQLQAERLDGEHACGYRPIQGLLLSARRRGLTARTLDQRNSGDTAGPGDRVVGYGAYVFH